MLEAPIQAALMFPLMRSCAKPPEAQRGPTPVVDGMDTGHVGERGGGGAQDGRVVRGGIHRTVR